MLKQPKVLLLRIVLQSPWNGCLGWFMEGFKQEHVNQSVNTHLRCIVDIRGSIAHRRIGVAGRGPTSLPNNHGQVGLCGRGIQLQQCSTYRSQLSPQKAYRHLTCSRQAISNTSSSIGPPPPPPPPPPAPPPPPLLPLLLHRHHQPLLLLLLLLLLRHRPPGRTPTPGGGHDAIQAS